MAIYLPTWGNGIALGHHRFVRTLKDASHDARVVVVRVRSFDLINFTLQWQKMTVANFDAAESVQVFRSGEAKSPFGTVVVAAV